MNADNALSSKNKKALACDKPWAPFSIEKEMGEKRYDERRRELYREHPELDNVSMGGVGG